MNDMSHAGGLRQLDVSINRKFYRSASGGTIEVLREMAFTLTPRAAHSAASERVNAIG